MKYDRKLLEKAVEKYPKITSRNFVLASKLSQKQLSNAIKHIDKFAKPEEVVAFLDRTLFANGKDGILITTEKIVSSDSATSGAYFEKFIRAEASVNELSVFYADNARRKIKIKTYAEEAASLLNTIVKLRDEANKTEEPKPEPAKPAVEAPKPASVPKHKSAPEQKKLPQDETYYLNMATECYKEGEYEKALEYFKKAAEKGSVTSAYNVGVFYNTGKGVRQDKEEAFRWFEKAAEKGYMLGQYVCGKALIYGTGTEKDYIKAEFWLKKAADQGDEESANLLRSIRSAVEEAKEAKEFDIPPYDEDKLFDYSEELYREGKIRESFLCCKKAANMGYKNAGYELGKKFYSGDGTEKNLEKAAFWFLWAAKRNHISALINLSEMIIKGEAKIYDSFIRVLEKGAEENTPSACYYLGLMYYYGKGLRKDYIKAYFYIEKSKLCGYMNKNIESYLEKAKDDYAKLNGENYMRHFYKMLSDMYKKEPGEKAQNKAREYLMKS